MYGDREGQIEWELRPLTAMALFLPLDGPREDRNDVAVAEVDTRFPCIFRDLKGKLSLASCQNLEHHHSSRYRVRSPSCHSPDLPRAIDSSSVSPWRLC